MPPEPAPHLCQVAEGHASCTRCNGRHAGMGVVVPDVHAMLVESADLLSGGYIVHVRAQPLQGEDGGVAAASRLCNAGVCMGLGYLHYLHRLCWCLQLHRWGHRDHLQLLLERRLHLRLRRWRCWLSRDFGPLGGRAPGAAEHWCGPVTAATAGACGASPAAWHAAPAVGEPEHG